MCFVLSFFSSKSFAFVAAASAIATNYARVGSLYVLPVASIACKSTKPAGKQDSGWFQFMRWLVTLFDLSEAHTWRQCFSSRRTGALVATVSLVSFAS